MEGSLLKKTTNGVWHQRQFKLEGTHLVWLRSDDKTLNNLDLRGVEVRDVKFGIKKFQFDLIVEGKALNFCASGEAEKAAWMSAISTAAGQAGLSQPSGAGRPSVRALGKKLPASGPLAVAAAAIPLPSAPATSPSKPATLEVASAATQMGSEAANEKLKQKLAAIKPAPAASNLCTVCHQPVYKMEELTVDKALMHKNCFRCAHCQRQLSLGNFAAVNKTLYCKAHYFELFSVAGGKYDKAFGDGGFAKKANIGYTPETLNVVGGASAKQGSSPPPPVASTPPAASTPPQPTALTPTQPAALAKPQPGKLTFKLAAPSDKPTPAKPKLEGLDKPRDMKALREMVAAGMMQKKEEPKSEGQEPAPATEGEKPADDEAAADVAAAAAAAPSSEQQEEPTVFSQQQSAQEDAPPPRATLRGPNFALEAMKIRQAQMENRKSLHHSHAAAPKTPARENKEPDEPEPVGALPGTLDNNAALSKPRIAAAKRRRPTAQIQEIKMLPKAEIDRMKSDFTFRVSLDGKDNTEGPNVLWVHATSQFERDHWVATLGAAIHRLGLQHDLQQAQKTDMMSALACQMALEDFLKNNPTTYAGFLEKLSMKSHRNWKKRYFVLNDQGCIEYFDTDKSKKANASLQLTFNSTVLSAEGERLNGPVVLNTGIKASEELPPGELPDNIAVFDGKDVTVDLETIVADVPEDVQLEDLAKMELIPDADDEDLFVIEAPDHKEDIATAVSSSPLKSNVPPDFFAVSPTKSETEKKKAGAGCTVM